MKLAFTVGLLFVFHHMSMVISQADKMTNVHLLMSNEERMMVFGSDQIPDYSLVQPVQLSKDRHRRYLSSDTAQVDLMLSLSIDDKDVVLHLNKRNSLIKTPMKVNVMDGNAAENYYMLNHPKCIYHGNVHNMENSAVAISTCNPNQMAGIIHLSDEEHYILSPLPNRIRRDISGNSTKSENNSSHHVLYKRSSQNIPYANSENLPKPLNSVFATNEYDWTENLNSRRLRRDLEPDERVVELHVFVDDVLYKIIAKENPEDPNKNIINRVLTFINAVQLIYEQPALSVSIRFTLVGITIFKKDKGAPSKGDGDIAAYIGDFGKWQSKINPKGDHNEEHWDHAMILSGLDLYMGKKTDTQVIGVAYLNGMCHKELSTSVSEGRGLNVVYVISHELGHNLGMQHDGEGNKCDSGKNIMSPSLGHGKTLWSKCSNDYLVKFLGKKGSKCVLDDSYPVKDMDHRSHLLPGEQYNLKDQCVFSYGSSSKPYTAKTSPYNNVCEGLWCQVKSSAFWSHPALDGSLCGPSKREDTSKMCYHGKCVDKEETIQYLKSRDILIDE